MTKTIKDDLAEIDRLQKQIDNIRARQQSHYKQVLNDALVDRKLENELGFTKDPFEDSGSFTWAKEYGKDARIFDYVTYSHTQWEFSRYDDWNGENLIEKLFDDYEQLLSYLRNLKAPSKNKYVLIFEFEAYENDDLTELAFDELNGLDSYKDLIYQYYE